MHFDEYVNVRIILKIIMSLHQDDINRKVSLCIYNNCHGSDVKYQDNDSSDYENYQYASFKHCSQSIEE